MNYSVKILKQSTDLRRSYDIGKSLVFVAHPVVAALHRMARSQARLNSTASFSVKIVLKFHFTFNWSLREWMWIRRSHGDGMRVGICPSCHHNNYNGERHHDYELIWVTYRKYFPILSNDRIITYSGLPQRSSKWLVQCVKWYFVETTIVFICYLSVICVIGTFERLRNMITLQHLLSNKHEIWAPTQTQLPG